MSQIYSVKEITHAIKQTLEGSYPFVWVKGEIANLARPASGHVYFSLKDTDATLSCVWFKSSQRGDETFDPLTGEVYEEGPRPSLARTMREGQEILCAGKLNVYPPRGAYQLVVELAQDAGIGQLYLEFEKLKQELAAKGYFDKGRKRELPHHPKRVAVVTAASGAAIQDFLRIAEDRGWGACIDVYPTLVQGDAAPEQIAKAIRQANRQAEDMIGANAPDVIAVIRGGGSIEDLWSFNDPRVADAIFTSNIPVISGVGHEVDTTIADLVADVRAATPSHAAQLLWPERKTLVQSVDELELALFHSIEDTFERLEQSLETLSKGLSWLSPERKLERWDERFSDLAQRLQRSWKNNAQQLDNTLDVLQRRVEQSFGVESLVHLQQRVEGYASRLQWAGEQRMMKQQHTLERLTMQLEGLDPQKPLERGYSLVQLRDGTFIRSISDVAQGDSLDVIVRDGTVQVDVMGTTERKDNDGV